MAAPMILKRVHKLKGLFQDLEQLRAHTCQPCRFKNMYSAARKGKAKKLAAAPEKIEEKKIYKGERPLHTVYLAEDYPPQAFSLAECFNMHQEAAQPTMANTPDTQIYADVTLDLTTKKKTKFIKHVRGLMEYPHQFNHEQKKVYILFSENKSDIEYAQERNAMYAGGDDIYNYIKQNLIRREDIEACDFVFATPTMAVKLISVRSFLMDLLPTKKNGCIIETSLEQVWERHETGVSFKAVKESDQVGRAQIPFGQLNQDYEKVKENFEHMMKTLAEFKPANTGQIVKEVSIVAPPSEERFLLSRDDYQNEKKSRPSRLEQEDEDSDEEGS
ncbi:39S ribosomal protein L1, mitochondrial-like isoform X2 [Mya arenaria]|uniref:39S ribosomal protein L1, mitochondrial-like isoform X2 n=1 Tax=Mya arenaria TaxID=6604 RepID=UPI0022E62F03|nr:39S ribosomal protein L1, mitochondrial-like isoform X2 [Mya arenaria]